MCLVSTDSFWTLAAFLITVILVHTFIPWLDLSESVETIYSAWMYSMYIVIMAGEVNVGILGWVW